MPDSHKPPVLECACGCGATFTPPASALNKRFASRECRMGFHAREMREARALAAELRANRTQPKAEMAADTWANRGSEPCPRKSFYKINVPNKSTDELK